MVIILAMMLTKLFDCTWFYVGLSNNGLRAIDLSSPLAWWKSSIISFEVLWSVCLHNENLDRFGEKWAAMDAPYGVLPVVKSGLIMFPQMGSIRACFRPKPDDVSLHTWPCFILCGMLTIY